MPYELLLALDEDWLFDLARMDGLIRLIYQLLLKLTSAEMDIIVISFTNVDGVCLVLIGYAVVEKYCACFLAF